MSFFCKNKAAVVEHVNDRLEVLSLDWPSTMTITPVKSGGYSVLTAIDMSSDDIELQRAKFYSETQVTT